MIVINPFHDTVYSDADVLKMYLGLRKQKYQSFVTGKHRRSSEPVTSDIGLVTGGKRPLAVYDDWWDGASIAPRIGQGGLTTYNYTYTP